jgi:hypothetical protein
VYHYLSLSSPEDCSPAFESVIFLSLERYLLK